MRRYLSIIFGSFLLSLVACNGNLDELDRTPDGNGKIIVSAKSLGVTRSADTDVESTLAWIDVYVMDESKNIVHSERIDKSASPVVGGGEFTLSKNREDFEKNKGYYFYMIANSTEPLSTAKTWDELKKLSQRDEHLHLSGITGIEDLTVPKYFLMDGFAYVPTAGSTTAPAEMPLMVLNNGVNDDDLILGGTLVRAASKIMITIKQGDSVEFKETLDGATPLYSYYQLPISTLMVRPDATTFFNSEKQNTKEWGIDNRNQSFNWETENGAPQLTLVGYAYANDWSKNPANESALLLSIPMMWDKDGDLGKEESNGKEAASPVNWYKVPLSKNDKFERNKCYVINITINAVGAEEQNTPIELKDIEYVTLDWQDVHVSLGDTSAKYLTLNTDLVKIYDTNFDLDQLTFASSSPIKSIKLKDTFNESNGSITPLKVTKESDGTTEVEYEEGDGVYAYYIDKFGQKIQLGEDPGFDLHVVEQPSWDKANILNHEANLLDAKQKNEDGSFVLGEDGNPVSMGKSPEVQHIRAVVPDDQKRALNGNIHIYSPINAVAGNDDLNWNSHFNTVRYLEFEVMNEQGLTATFRVEQTPVTVIRNLEGFFSYRDDFRVGNDPVQFNADAFTTSVGKTKPVDQGPIHFLNPVSPFFVLAGFLPYHAHEVNDEGVLLLDNCNSSYKGYEELLYGFMERNYHRSYSFGGPIAGVFHRDHYDNVDGKPVPSDATLANGNNKYYQAFGLIYDDEATGKSFRRHYTGNFFETFWSKVVGEVYQEDVVIEYPIVRTDLVICRYCMENKSTNPDGKPYILATECPYYPDKSANHKKKYVTGYPCKVGTRTVKVPKGQAAIYKLSPTDNYDDWEHYTTTFYFTTPRDKSSTAYYFPTYEYPEAQPSFFNHRMYHVRVTTTSNEYTVAAPRLMDEDGNPTEDRERGYTLESEDNAKVVSPSFMVASQLGESILPTQEHNYVMPGIQGFYYYAKRQCQEYVETRYDDENGNNKYDVGEPVYHYNDWRLPTKAEIDYIIEHQETSRAMDKVMYAQYYYVASTKAGVYTEDTLLSNEIPNYNTSYTGWYMRCVRDAFKEPEPVYYNKKN